MQGYGPGRDPGDWDDLSDFPDPWNGDHNIEYWVWDGVRLVPATPEERARIQEDERTQAARRRLEQLQERERRETHSMKRRLSTAKVWWRGRVSVAMQWLRSTWQPRQSPHAKETKRAHKTHKTHAEHSPPTGDATTDAQQERGFQTPL
jgi:hypothetical protein